MTPQIAPRDDADDALARAARRAHAASLDHLSPRVQAQLAQRRRAASQPRRSAARGWPLIATASTAALALAIGVFALRDDGTGTPRLASTHATTPSTGPASPAATAVPGTATALPDTLIAAEFDANGAIDYGTFDETPDFYAWLGAQDTLVAAPESL